MWNYPLKQNLIISYFHQYQVLKERIGGFKKVNALKDGFNLNGNFETLFYKKELKILYLNFIFFKVNCNLKRLNTIY